jgi:hypothetical protein
MILLSDVTVINISVFRADETTSPGISGEDLRESLKDLASVDQRKSRIIEQL